MEEHLVKSSAILANSMKEGRVQGGNLYGQEGNIEWWGSIGWIMEA